jgi:hypothetical protein
LERENAGRFAFPRHEILVGSPPMPRTAEDIENYLLQLDRRFERSDDSSAATFLIHSAGATVALRVSAPIAALRVIIGLAPAEEQRRLALFRQLLEYNVNDLMHVSYGLHGEQVVLSGALELENLDMNELEAALSDIDLALARHVPTLHVLAGREDRRSQRPAG